MDIKERDSVVAHHAKVLALVFAPQGNYLVSTGADGIIQSWKTSKGKLSKGPSFVADSRDIRSLAFWNNTDCHIADEKEVRAGCLNIGPGTGGSSRSQITFKTQPGSRCTAIQEHQNYRAWGFGSECFLKGDNHICSYNLDSEGNIRALFFQDDGKRLIAHTTGSITAVLEIKGFANNPKLSLIKTIPDHSVIDFEPSTGVLALANENTISLFTTSTGDMFSAIPLTDCPRITSLKLTYDLPLISGHEDGTIRCWDTLKQTCLETFDLHDHSVNCLAFTANKGPIFASGGYGVIKLWSLQLQEKKKSNSQAEIASTVKKLSAAKAEIKVVREALEKQKKIIATLESALDTERTDKSQAQADSKRLEYEITELKDRHQAKRESLHKELGRMEVRLDQAQTEVASLKEALKQERAAAKVLTPAEQARAVSEEIERVMRHIKQISDSDLPENEKQILKEPLYQQVRTLAGLRAQRFEEDH